MALGFIFHHGWGLDKMSLLSLGEELHAAFRGSRCVYVDRGYFGDGSFFSQEELHLEERLWIGVGHSLGFSSLFQWPVHHLISINGFTRFCSQPVDNTKKEGTPLRLLDRMIAQFDRDPVQVLKEFYTRSGLSYPKEPFPFINTQLLLEDLRKLKEIDITKMFLEDLRPCLSLRSDRDVIVTTGLYEETIGLKKTACHTYSGGGHGLSPEFLSFCVSEIIRWVAKNA